MVAKLGLHLIKQFQREDRGEASRPTQPSGGDTQVSKYADNNGIKVLAYPQEGISPEEVVDIVAVHGLAGHREKTWLHESSGKLWLRDFLPSAIPNARIMTFGYDANLVGRSVLGIMENAEGLLTSVKSKRFDCENRPLIFIAHSLGGLVVKKALLKAEAEHSSLAFAVRGIVFMAVPHKGANIATYATYLAMIANIAVPINEINLKELAPDSRPLDDLSDSFGFIRDRYRYISVFEGEETGSVLPRGSVWVVPAKSARIDAGALEDKFTIPGADHRTVCKFGSPTGMYETLSNLLKHMARQALMPRGLEDTKAGRTAQSNSRLSYSPRREPLPAMSAIDCDCLQALANPDADPIAKKAAIPPRAPGTCEWFLKHDKYLDWIAEPESKLLWITGHPGCGKTVLASFLIDHLNESEEGAVVCYFFCDDKTESFAQAISILRATLHMLFSARRDLLCYALKEFQSKGQGFSKELITMWEILLEAAQDHRAGTVYCIIDAINECEPQGREALLSLVTSYFGRKTLAGGHLKLLITSRPELRVIEDLSKVSRSRLRTEDEQDNIEKDVKAAIRHGLRRYAATSHCTERFRSTLEEILTNNAEKTFLWVSLILETLVNEAGESEERLLEMVKSFPKQLDETYEAILNRVPLPQRLNTKKILSVVISALRPLTVSELNMSMALHAGDLNEDDCRPRLFTEPVRIVRRACGALIRIYESRLYLIHQTAKEFLLSPTLDDDTHGQWKGFLNPTETNLALGQSCLWYLQFTAFSATPLEYDHEHAYSPHSRQRMNDYTNKHLFLEYSARFWMTHLRESQKVADKDLIDLASILCDAKTHRFWTWFQIHWILSDFTWGPCPRGLSALAIASLFGLDVVAKALLKRVDLDPDAGDTHGRTALSWAAEMGRTSIVKELCTTGKVKLESEDDSERTPLAWAALLGQTETVRYLAEEAHANVNAVDVERWTPLSWAAMFGQLETVKVLLRCPEVVVEHRDILGRTPLSLAALNGHEKVVKLLIARTDVDINSKDSLEKTPLLRASQEGQEAVVRLLIGTPGVELDSPDLQKRTPLLWAAKNGHEKVVRLLLDTGRAEPDRKDVFNIPPIAWAAHGGYVQTVQILATRHDVGESFTEKQAIPPEVDPAEVLEQHHEAVVARMLVKREHCTVEYLLRFAPSWGRFDNEAWYQTVENMLSLKFAKLHAII